MNGQTNSPNSNTNIDQREPLLDRFFIWLDNRLNFPPRPLAGVSNFEKLNEHLALSIKDEIRYYRIVLGIAVFGLVFGVIVYLFKQGFQLPKEFGIYWTTVWGILVAAFASTELYKKRKDLIELLRKEKSPTHLSTAADELTIEELNRTMQ
jgi:hypothetical protein